MSGTPWLLDTNILLRLANRETRDHQEIRRCTEWLWSKGAVLLYTSQTLAEFWNVCTRPLDRNGFGLSIEETDERTALIEAQLSLAADSEAVHRAWRRIIVENRVSGVQVRDTRLVAALRVHGVSNLLTLNLQDFRRYRDIKAFSPDEALREG